MDDPTLETKEYPIFLMEDNFDYSIFREVERYLQDKEYIQWKAKLKKQLWDKHINDTKGMDRLQCIEKYNKFNKGFDIDYLCIAWALSWPTMKLLVDSGKINVTLPTRFSIDEKAGVVRRPSHTLLIQEDEIIRIENENTTFKNNRQKFIEWTGYSYTFLISKEYSLRLKHNEDRKEIECLKTRI